MDGSINIQETERTAAYRQGIASGQPFAITAYGRDYQSSNLLDRIEITYEFNQESNTFEQSSISRVPGTQIEQRRVREILSGDSKVFENFINDLWYHVNPDGTIDRNQYIYFDPVRREIIFYSNETQQIYAWQQSISTRHGLHVTSQNISVSTLRRIIDIEMVSMDSVRLRVNERIQLRLDVIPSWDGLYRRATQSRTAALSERTLPPYTEAVFDSSMGRIHFHANGEFELSSGGTLTRGRYAFFQAAGSNLLELRPDNAQQSQTGIPSSMPAAMPAVGTPNGNRQVFLITAAGIAAGISAGGLTGAHVGGEITLYDNFILSRVRLGAAGIQDLHESPIIMTRAQ